MGKTPKKAAPGGDERNLYNRRLLKATTAASEASETNLHKRQRDSENSNRSKLSTIPKKIPSEQRKSVKSKLDVPAQSELNCAKKLVGRPPGSSKEKKIVVPDKSVESKFENMQPESEEAEVKPDAIIQNEDAKKDTSHENQEIIDERVDHVSLKHFPDSKEQENATIKESSIVEEEQIVKQEITKDSNKIVETKEISEPEEIHLTLSFESEDNPAKVEEDEEEKKSNDTDTKDNSKEECPSVQPESKNDIQEKEDVQSESQTDTESYSVDILESTTSELSEVSEIASQNDNQKEKEKPEEDGNIKDVSFVSYDSSIMLKDVQIKLNDCMKENTKLFEASNTEYDTLAQSPKDTSFGKTLRSISGRRSLNRMRHVTIREHRYSLNNSMFVNTSNTSLLPDETEDFKILRYTTGLSDMVSTTNGSPNERKRKYETEDWSSSTKKQKTESENSLLNTSISLLKGLRRPIQVSTSVSELKFQTSKLDLTNDESNTSDAHGRRCFRKEGHRLRS
ncbi:uncharacterized protein LOC143146390 [Ptiloglossa arizonensis]|uniref:uncharacterized protein LOC143146390 n=1 Tax=Ptiloglossa arizonensis TaxID=3350558 RepID=UPI003FA13B38